MDRETLVGGVAPIEDRSEITPEELVVVFVKAVELERYGSDVACSETAEETEAASESVVYAGAVSVEDKSSTALEETDKGSTDETSLEAPHNQFIIPVLDSALIAVVSGAIAVVSTVTSVASAATSVVSTATSVVSVGVSDESSPPTNATP